MRTHQERYNRKSAEPKVFPSSFLLRFLALPIAVAAVVLAFPPTALAQCADGAGQTAANDAQDSATNAELSSIDADKSSQLAQKFADNALATRDDLKGQIDYYQPFYNRFLDAETANPHDPATQQAADLARKTMEDKKANYTVAVGEELIAASRAYEADSQMQLSSSRADDAQAMAMLAQDAADVCDTATAEKDQEKAHQDEDDAAAEQERAQLDEDQALEADKTSGDLEYGPDYDPSTRCIKP